MLITGLMMLITLFATISLITIFNVYKFTRIVILKTISFAETIATYEPFREEAIDVATQKLPRAMKIRQFAGFVTIVNFIILAINFLVLYTTLLQHPISVDVTLLIVISNGLLFWLTGRLKKRIIEFLGIASYVAVLSSSADIEKHRTQVSNLYDGVGSKVKQFVKDNNNKNNNSGE